MSKKQWGNATWYLFHTLAYKLKPEFCTEVPILLDYVYTICNNIPCPVCQAHAMKRLSTVNKSSINSNESFINFLWTFHNNINESIHQPKYTFDEMTAKYKTSSTVNIIKYFISVMKTAKYNHSLMGSFNRDTYITKFITYISNNIHKFNT